MRQGASWTVNFGADGTLDGPNFKVEEPGIYEVVLEIKSETEAVISLNKVGDAEDPEGTEPEDPRTEEEKNAWSVIGSICGTSWDTDFPMTENTDTGFSVFVSEPLELKEGEEFKVRQGAAWDVNYGADGQNGANVVVPADGTYVISFEPLSGALVLMNAETLEIAFLYEGVNEWGVVGTINGWGETEDLPMADEDGDNVYESEPIELKAGDEIKCRFNADWTLNFGADGQDGANVKVEADGLYIVVLDLNAGTVTLKPAE